MGNPSRERQIRVEDDVYTIVFNNAGLRAAEDMLGEGGNALRQHVNTMQISDRIETALLWGATRKFHARDVRDIDDVDQLKDRINDYYEEEDDEDAVIDNYMAPLIACYLRVSNAYIGALMKGEEPEVDESGKGNRAQRRAKGKGGSAEKSGPKEKEEKAS